MKALLFDGVPRRIWIILAVLLALLVAAPFVVNDYLLTILILILYFAYVGQTWNIMMGFAGQLSLGHALYVGLGAYTTAALYVHFGLRPWLGLPVAIAISRPHRRRHRLPRLPFPGRWRLFRNPDHRIRRVRSHRLRPFRLGQRLEWLVSAGRQLHAERSVEPARQADHVLLHAAGAHRRGAGDLPCAAAQPRRLFLACDSRGRGGRPRARHRHIPLQDVSRSCCPPA